MKVKIFLDDLYKNGVEPKKGETVYQIDNKVVPIYLTHSIETEHVKVGKYGGKVDDKTFHTSKNKYDYLLIDNCYIKADITLKNI